jgi:hypothetical protein
MDLFKVEDIEENARGRAYLAYTKTITEEDLRLPEWESLYRNYQKANIDLTLIICSIMNSVIYQRRVCFNMTRDGLRNLIKNDKNIQALNKIASFRNENYPQIIKSMIDSGLVRALLNKEGKVYGFQVVKEAVLNRIVVDTEIQRQELHDLMENRKDVIKTKKLSSEERAVNRAKIRKQVDERFDNKDF